MSQYFQRGFDIFVCYFFRNRVPNVFSYGTQHYTSAVKSHYELKCSKFILRFDVTTIGVKTSRAVTWVLTLCSRTGSLLWIFRRNLSPNSSE
jgi:hypothetical protein